MAIPTKTEQLENRIHLLEGNLHAISQVVLYLLATHDPGIQIAVRNALRNGKGLDDLPFESISKVGDSHRIEAIDRLAEVLTDAARGLIEDHIRANES